ncbi:uncharacterized protein Fot_06874 [Forsythia ovata]|uniref:RING-type domain-containing protein n=1 Tax=Forsythia ovata TaxID=205694 RepID=A0ABD1WUV9_9LAMI
MRQSRGVGMRRPAREIRQRSEVFRLRTRCPRIEEISLDHQSAGRTTNGKLASAAAPPLPTSAFCKYTCSTSGCFRCGLCERFLSQISPWSSRRIVKSGDMPVAGVISCSHVFHAECLEQTTSKVCKNDPPCPICIRVEEENSPDQRVFSKLRNSFPRLKRFCEDGSSKP